MAASPWTISAHIKDECTDSFAINQHTKKQYITPDIKQ